MASSSPARSDPRPLVLLAVHKVLARIALADMLESGGFRVMSVASAEEALDLLGAGLGIKALVTDVSFTEGAMNGLELASRVHEEHPIDVVVVSEHAAPDPGELPPGACFIAKPVHKDTLVGGVARRQPELSPARTVTASGPIADWALTPRQHEVLALLMQGKSNQQIAETMGLSANTVKVHLVTIFRVLGVHSRTEALLAGMRRLPSG